MAEHPAVNRRVVGSSPTVAAIVRVLTKYPAPMRYTVRNNALSGSRAGTLAGTGSYRKVYRNW